MQYFFEDSNLYTLWVYSEPKFHPRDYFGLEEIMPIKWREEWEVLYWLEDQLDDADVPLDKFSSYIRNANEEIGIPPSEERLNEETPQNKKKILRASKKFSTGSFGIKELEILSPFLNDNISRYFCMCPKLTGKSILRLKAQREKYIDLFLNNEILVYDQNYFAFEKQKQCFIQKVKEMKALEHYGKNFIVSETIEDDRRSKEENGFLFIHTLLALQKLGYIEVLRLWYSAGDTYEDCVYHASIIVSKSFIDEVYSSYRKDNPSNIIESFDEKRGTLRFAGREIELAKKGKETDAVLLLKTLLKADGDEWVHEDEILGDWGYNDDDRKDLPKNKVYFAGQKVNTAVELKTSISDFLECSTTKARINPKYRKVDE